MAPTQEELERMETHLPHGCDWTFQISHIDDKELRPQDDYEWLVVIVEEGERQTTCRRSIDECMVFVNAVRKAR